MENALIAENLKRICKERNLSMSTLLAECGIRKSLIYDLEKRDYTPSISIMETLANRLNTSIDELVGRTSHISYGGIKENSFVGQGSGISNTNKFTTNDTLDDDTKEVIRILKGLSPRKRHELIGIIFDFADENM